MAERAGDAARLAPAVSGIRIAAAQSISVAGDIAANVHTHARFIAAAHAAGVDILLFPELSLCGYELPLLRHCCLRADDARLSPLRDLVRQSGMTVVVGAPLDGGRGTAPSIAAISMHPDGTTSVYRKQYLHPGEEQYASSGDVVNGGYRLREEAVALAICADTAQEPHAARAAASGASLYLVGVLVSRAGYATDSANLQRHAATRNMGVLMANHGAPTGGYVSAGRSAFWAPGGDLVIAAPAAGSLLLIASKRAGIWSGELRPVKV